MRSCAASIMRYEDSGKITAIARRNGMQKSARGWLDKARRGVTSAEEVMRVTQEL